MKRKIYILVGLIIIGLFVFCLVRENFEIRNKKNQKSIKILMYHGVRDDAWGDKSMFNYVEDFEEQMKYLYDSGFTPIFLSEIENADDYEKPIVITFDDGYIDVYENAFPILQKYNFKSNFFIITNLIGGGAYVNNDMIAEMHESGLVEIGSHSVTHNHLIKMKKEEVEKELKNSKEYLEKLLGTNINTIAFPYGERNSVIDNIVKQYYDYAVVTGGGKNYSESLNLHKLSRTGVLRGMDFEKFKKSLD